MRSGIWSEPTARILDSVGCIRAVWRSTKSESCDHPANAEQKLRLPPGCVTMCNICSGGYEDSYPKVTICLTANHAVGRWRALCQVALLCSDKSEEEAYGAHILLRGDDCCFSCAVDQVAARPGRFVHHIVKRVNIHTFWDRVVAGELSPSPRVFVEWIGRMYQSCHRGFIEIDSSRWSHID